MITYKCSKCKNDTDGLFPTFEAITGRGVWYVCVCTICLNKTNVLASSFERFEARHVLASYCMN